MTQKKPSRGGITSGDDPDDLHRSPLQAVLLADSFAQKFRPITLERPKVLMPLVHVPLISYTLSWLESVGVDEVFVFCCSHAQQVKDYIDTSEWGKGSSGFSVVTIESHDAVSAGDALRFIYNLGVIHGDFVLIAGDTVSNINLASALEEHKQRRKKDPLAVMTMIIRHLKSSPCTHQTHLGNGEIFMAIHPDTKELLYYEDDTDSTRRLLAFDKNLLESNPSLHLQADKEDCHIDICSPEVLSLFTDNFDFQHLRRHFVKGLLIDDIMGYKIFTHEIHASYAARLDNFRSYDAISKDIIQRWTYPLVPDLLCSGKGALMRLHRQGIYKASDIKLSHSARVGAYSVLGSGSSIGDGSVILNSVIGEHCTIGQNVVIRNCYIWNSVVIENNCKLSHSLVCDGVHLHAGAILEPGAIISYMVEVGENITISSHSKVSLLPQPAKQDSDEELEYADGNSGIIGSPTIMTTRSADSPSQDRDSSDNEQLSTSGVGISGVGFVWSNSESGAGEEWRYSLAPIPVEKLLESNIALDNDTDTSDLESNNTLHPEEIKADSDNGASNDGYGNVNQDYTKFEEEVDETFRRALGSLNPDNVVIIRDNLLLEINALRLSYNMSETDSAGALFYSIMSSAVEASRHSDDKLLTLTSQAIDQWKDILTRYMRTADEEIEVILKFEEMCLEGAKEFSPLFEMVLHLLYDKDVITEDAILSWAREKEGADELDKIFVKKAEAFIKWLKEASEEDEDQ